MQKYLFLLTLMICSFCYSSAQTALRVEAPPTVECDESLLVNITVEDFTDLTDIEFSVNWDETRFTYDAIVMANAAVAANDIYGTPQSSASIDEGELTFRWSGASTTISPSEVLFVLRLNTIGNANTGASTISITDLPVARSATDDQNVTTSINVTNDNVPIVDSESPTVTTCPGPITLIIPASQNTAIAMGTTPTFMDNCNASLAYTLSGATVQNTPESGSANGEVLNRGFTNINYRVTDDAGNSTTCTVQVEVKDPEPLTLVADADAPECNSNIYRVDIDVRDFTDITDLQFSMNFDATVLDFLSVDNVIFTDNFNFNSDPTELDNGILTFTWAKASNPNIGISYGDNTRIFSVVFDVIGNIGDDTNFTFSDNNVTQMAMASINGQPTDITIQSIGSNEEIEDNEAPVFMNCPTTITRAVNATGSGSSACGAIVNFAGPTATDNCGTVNVTSTANSGDYFGIGFNTVTYTATDDANNSTQCQFVIRVVDTESPMVTCTDRTFNISNTGTVTISPSDVGTATDNCTISSTSVTPNEFTCTDRGTNVVTYTTTDASGNSSTCTATITINDVAGNCGSFVMPVAGDQNTLNELFGPTTIDASIADPCSCRNNLPTLENGETSDNGLFNDEVIVISRTAGDTWEVIRNNTDSRPLPFDRNSGFFNAQPEDLDTVSVGDQFTFTGTFTDAGITYYVYSLEIIHQDNVGYSLTAREVNGRYDDLPMAGNTCYYPDPFIDNILRTYTPDCGGAVTIRGTEPNGVVGQSYTFTLVGPDPAIPAGGLIINSPDEPSFTFVPGTFQMGEYVATFRFNAGEAGSEDTSDPGCETTVEARFSVVAAPENLVCNNNVSVSLDEDCQAEITADNILEGDQIDYDLYDVDIMDEFGNSRGNIVTREDVGKTLMVAVRDNCTGNSCMGSITVEDKFAPRFECERPITVACTFNLDSIAAPRVIDNCDTTVVAILTNEVYEDFGCDGVNNIVARVTRTYIARDEYGNTSNPCTQVINLQKFTLANVRFPLDYNGMPGQLDPLSCSNVVSTEPDSTGFPTINGGPIDGNDVCKIVASYQDERINNCGGSYDIVRTWSVFDWCEPLVDGVNPRTDVQIIKVMDNQAPVLTCPQAITLSANNNDCTASTNLPPAAITDACSNFTVRVSTPRGVLETNGGQVNNLPIGNYTITYSATDECGNVGTCDVEVNVVDNVGPFAILEDEIKVTLNNGGMVEVQSESFNDNSYDNCTNQVTLLVKRAGTDDPFAPSVQFVCADAGQLINIMVQVTDSAGNSTIGWSTVRVADDSAPLISGPPSPITIDCTQDINDLDLTGRATVTAGCGTATLIYQDFVNSSSSCGDGSVSRVFTARDDSGNESTFVQTINITNNRQPLALTDITFPRDTIFADGCTVGTHPDDLPAGYNRPQIGITTCTTDQIAISFSDEILRVVGATDGACFKILRTWVVIDWCEYESGQNNRGRFEDLQVIKVTDNNAPVVTCPTNIVIDINENNCNSGTFTIPQPTVTDCSDELEVVQSGDFGSASDLDNIAPGTYNVRFEATDACGNVGGCNMTVTVRDTRAPQGQCANVTDIEMTGGQVEVEASRFVNSVTDNCTPSNQIIVAFSRNVNDLTRIFTCNDRGLDTLQLYARDLAGNWAEICRPAVNVIDADASCPPGLIASVNGLVHTDNGDMVENVMIYVNGGMTDSVATNVDGSFAVNNLPLNGDYSFTPSRTDDLRNGVTTFDMVLMLKHILDIKKLDSPYRIIAADINNSGTITTLDMVQLRKVLLQYEDEFPNNNAWRFVLNDFQFTDATNPFSDDFPEVYNVNNLGEDATIADFVAIKVGDLNGDAIPNALVTVDERNEQEQLVLKTAEQTFTKGQQIEVPVYAKDFEVVTGMQFDLQFAPAQLNLLDIQPQQGLALEDFGTVNTLEGILSVSWGTATAKSFSTETPVFTLVFTAEENGQLSNALQMTPAYLESEVYVDNATNTTQLGLRLQIGAKDWIKDNVTLFQNKPNPFRGQTTVSFQLGTATMATLKVYDVAGRVVYQHTKDYTAGYHEVELSNLKASGILYYQLESSTFVATKKMILLD